ncbi:MAG: NAD(P)H-quinone oxidoreductase, partial [Myxococcota bacterium]
DVLEAIETEVPTPALGEVLIRVAFAGVNRPDVLQRLGRYPLPADASPFPGLEVSGEVVASKDPAFSVGDAVCALCNGGGYAEYVVAPAGQVLPVPPGLDLAEAAALPETFFTVWVNLMEHGRFKPGDHLLIHGGSSGIGTTAIQIARAFDAGSVTVTAGSDAKVKRCLELGATRAINYRDEDFAEAIEDQSLDLVLDMVGGDYVPKNLRLLRDRGRHVSIAFLRGPATELDLAAVLRRRLILTGSTLRPRSRDEKAVIAAGLREQVWPKLEDGSIRPVMDERFALADAAAAHRRMESSTHIGKIVLAVKPTER